MRIVIALLFLVGALDAQPVERAEATTPFERMHIVHDYLYPGVEGISMSAYGIIEWPKAGPPQPTLEEIDSHRDEWLAWQEAKAAKAEKASAVRELAILKLMRSEDPSAVTTAEVEAAEEKLQEAEPQ